MICVLALTYAVVFQVLEKVYENESNQICADCNDDREFCISE